MEIYKKICFFSISFAALTFAAVFASQAIETYKSHENLKGYYSIELENLYGRFYAKNSDGRLIWPQSEWERLREKLRDQMLVDGFDRAQIQRMENKARMEALETEQWMNQILNS